MRAFFRKHKVIRVFAIILLVLILIVLAALIFIKVWPSFGGKASSEDKVDYAKRATNYSDGKFHNEVDFDLMNWSGGEDPDTLSNKGKKPKDKLPVQHPEIKTLPEKDQITVTWLGHSSLLIQMHGLNILMDPMMSQMSSPVSFAGSQRFSEVPIPVEDLPHIDLVLFSHDHYDHLDYDTVKKLREKVDCFVVPLGVENHLERWDVPSDKIHNMAWWEQWEVKGLTIGCTPAQHYSNRSIDDSNATLWASWVLKDEYHQIYESGDSGYGKHYEEIHDKYGDFDFVLMECAQYNKSWPNVHMFPEEAVKAVKTLGAKKAMPIHWGAFSLARHAWDDPVARFVKAGEATQLVIATPELGQTITLGKEEQYQNRWYNDYQ